MAVLSRKKRRGKAPDTSSWKVGREPVTIDIPRDLEKTLKKLARQSGIEYTQFVSMLLEYQVRQKMTLEACVEKMVKKALDKEMRRLGQIIAPFIDQLPAGKLTKNSSN